MIKKNKKKNTIEKGTPITVVRENNKCSCGGKYIKAIGTFDKNEIIICSNCKFTYVSKHIFKI